MFFYNSLLHGPYLDRRPICTVGCVYTIVETISTVLSILHCEKPKTFNIIPLLIPLHYLFFDPPRSSLPGTTIIPHSSSSIDLYVSGTPYLLEPHKSLDFLLSHQPLSPSSTPISYVRSGGFDIVLSSCSIPKYKEFLLLYIEVNNFFLVMSLSKDLFENTRKNSLY